MSLTPSTMLPLGTSLPAFELPDTRGLTLASSQLQGGEGVLVVFMCNHCPYVKHIRHELARLTKEWIGQGLNVVGINSNDAENYPADGPKKMAEEAREMNYAFAYLYDESQSIAHAFRAACTPDFFLFDREARLVYRGQFDSSRPGNQIPVTGENVRLAVEALLAGRPISSDQTPSIGCNIKWKPGNEPDYF